jgi:hypothetical protein
MRGRRTTGTPRAPTPEQQLAGVLARYDPAVAARARQARARLRKRLAGAVEIVYDNYNALVIGFGPTERPSDAVFSIAVYPRWVSLFFLRGAVLHDPRGLLRGSGARVRSVVLEDAAQVDAPGVRALIAQALKASPPFDGGRKRRLVVRSVSASQRPRRPLATRGGPGGGAKSS